RRPCPTRRSSGLVAGGEGGVAARMPVLGGDHGAVGARGGQVGDAGHDRVALVAGERAAGHEVGLEVDHQQGGGGGVGRGHRGGVTGRGRGGGRLAPTPALPRRRGGGVRPCPGRGGGGSGASCERGGGWGGLPGRRPPARALPGGGGGGTRPCPEGGGG